MSLQTAGAIHFPIHEYCTSIQERHLDTFGHVNNAQYLRLFEEARWEMITSRGYGLEEVRQTQVSTVILECSVRFKREIRLREKIIISTQVESISAKTLCLHHRILKEDGKVASESRFTLGCFDLRARKLISLEGDWLAAITGVRN